MLVLSRRVNETIIINDNIVITVVDIRGDKVRLGIDAPKDVSVHRREVFDAIRRGEVRDSTPKSDPTEPKEKEEEKPEEKKPKKW